LKALFRKAKTETGSGIVSWAIALPEDDVPESRKYVVQGRVRIGALQTTSLLCEK
jgi:hypothetical protein